MRGAAEAAVRELRGAGRTEVLRAVFGIDAVVGGEIRVAGTRVPTASPPMVKRWIRFPSTRMSICWACPIQRDWTGGRGSRC